LGDEADTRDVAEQESHLMEALGRCGRAGANVAIEDGKAEANPVHSRLFFKENNQRVRYLTDNEEKRPREAIEETQWPMVAVAIHTGLRQSEQFHLRWEHVDFANGVLTVPRSKSGRRRHVPMNETYARQLPPRLPPTARWRRWRRTVLRKYGCYRANRVAARGVEPRT